MRRQLLIPSAVLLLALLWVTSASLRTPAEPVWNGRTLTAWIDDFATGSSKEVREPAEEAIRAIGPAAVPSLIRMLRARRTFFDRVRHRLNRHQKFVRFKVASVDALHWRALLGFQALREKGENAIPELGRMLVKEPKIDFVPEALSAISPKCVPVLLDALPRVAPERRCVIFSALARWPSQESLFAPALRRAVSDANPEVRICAAEWLRRCRIEIDANIQTLVMALNDPEFQVRTHAAASLGHFGTNATAAVPALRKLCEHPKLVSADTVSNALFQIERARDH